MPQVQIARPASDISTGNWTPTPIFQQLREVTPDDATKVSSATPGDQFEVKFSAVAWPSPGDEVLSVRLRGPEDFVVAIELLEGVSTIASRYVYPTPDFTTYERRFPHSLMS